MLHTIEFPAISDSKVKAAAAEYQRLLAELRNAEKVVADLGARRPQAVEADRRALAAALRAGEPERASTEVDVLDADLAAAQRRAEALAVAVAEATAELTTIIETRRFAWAADLDRQIGKDRRALAEAVEAMGSARDALSQTLAARAWLNSFPRKTAVPMPAATAAIRGLAGRNGDPVMWGEILAALRAFASPPDPGPADEPAAVSA